MVKVARQRLKVRIYQEPIVNAFIAGSGHVLKGAVSA